MPDPEPNLDSCPCPSGRCKATEPVAMPEPLSLVLYRKEGIVLASWKGGESLHGKLVDFTRESVTLETAGVRFTVPNRHAREGVGDS
jgi:hypothetical protein